MRELRGDLWTYYDDGKWIAITTNGTVRHDGASVMGRGVALEAARRIPELPYRLGDRIRTQGNKVHTFSTLRLFCFPVKDAWQNRAILSLIEKSAMELRRLADVIKLNDVYLVRPGCGNGGLTWADVKPIIEPILDDRFAIVERNVESAGRRR